MNPLIPALFWVSCVLALAVERLHSNTDLIQRRDSPFDKTKVVEDVSPINLVYHVQITPKSWCNGSDRCFIAQNGAKQEVYVDWDASGKPRRWVGIPGTIRNLDVDVTFRCEAPAGAALCAWMRTPYKEYAVVDWVPGTPEMPRGHPVGKQMSMRAPSSTGIFEVYCVVGEDNCRGESDGYFQYDGLDEYHWHW
ncbi:hypothetical protein NpNSSI1_00000699 [Neofusicoccum parvum]|nr:hypothetical protein NpNSSI1_00000699 [Neofusicoccum parvum]